MSAKGRALGNQAANGSQLFEDFIQTDAAINPGNSGGALINARGELIGINTAILTGGNSMMGEGGNVGIGFAVPVNMARLVMDQLVKNGKVTRGYIGAYLQPINEKLAQQFGLKDERGALVAKVEPGKPADKAGIKAGDVIVGLNGQVIDDPNALTNMVVQQTPGSTVTLDAIRDGKPTKFSVTLGSRPSEGGAVNDGSNPSNRGENASGALQGVQVENLTPDVAQQLQLPSSTKGVVVSSVDDSSPAAEAGLQQGDVIQSVDKQPINNEGDFNRLMSKAGKSVLLLVNRGGRTVFMVVESK